MDPRRRIQKELEKMKAEPVSGIEASPVNGNLFCWRAQVAGPEGSPYEGGRFELDIRLPSRYPMEPPNVQFKTQIFHPNVDSRGEICLDVLKDQWSPALSLQKVLLSVSSLLTDPNFADPLNSSASQLYRKDRTAYESKCRQMTVKFAMGPSSGQKRQASEAGLDTSPPAEATMLATAYRGIVQIGVARGKAKAKAGVARAKAKPKAAQGKAKAKSKAKAKARTSASGA
mmetsp:Transcript_139020/g.443940  ORF Transcript_139020/g.443940 Transcript_139020/m.443940 type:complete len:229 (-) Transcript_139020:89-775(-)